MGRKAVQAPAAGGTAAAAAPPTRLLAVDGRPEPWEDSGGHDMHNNTIPE